MNIVIAGVGKFGKELTNHLSKENHNVIVVDTHAATIDDMVNQYDVMGYCGNIASYATQEAIEIGKYDLLVATTGVDEVNLLACLVAKKLGVNETIGRVRNPDYCTQTRQMTEDLGVSMTLNPDDDTAREIFRILRFPSACKVETFANGKVDLVEIKIEEDSLLANKTLMQIRSKYQVQILVCAVKRGNDVFIPKGDSTLEVGDYVYIAADSKEITSAFRKLNLFRDKLKSTMIIGGGKVTHYLADILIKNGIHVKIIDNDEEHCRKLAEDFPKALVIYGDGTNQKLLREEGIEAVDSVITLTGVDETNIIISTFAKSLNCEKVITKVNNSNYDLILDRVGLDSIVSPKEIFASHIIRYVRSMESTQGSECKTLYRLVNNKVEAMEFVISKPTMYTSIQLKDLHIRSNFLLACIIRDDKVIIPGGRDAIEPNDSVIIVTTSTSLKDVNDILE